MKTVNLRVRLLTCLIFLSLCTWSAASAQFPAGNPADFTYAGSPFCQNEPNVTPTAGNVGIFSEATGNIVFVSNVTGELNLPLCQPGTWTIKHVVFPDSTTRLVTIVATDDASFSYVPDTACLGVDSSMVPLVTGFTGGVFSSIPGLVLNAATGEVSVSATSAGTYPVTYATNGQCPSQEVDTVTIMAIPDATFSYASYDLCQQGTIAASALTPGGVFAATPNNLVINAATGEIDLAASTPGSYTVAYTFAGACGATFQRTVEITAPFVGALFTFPDSSFCVADPVQFPIVLGPSPLTFSGSSGLVFDSIAIGSLDISSTPAGSYTVTAVAPAPCAETWSQTIEVVDTALLSLVILGDSLIAPTVGTTYQWYLAGSLIPGATASIYVASQGGLYEVRYDFNCGAIASGTYVATTPASHWLASSNVYPNPSAGAVSYALSLQRPGPLAWELRGTLGNLLRSGSLGQSGRNFQGELDFSDLPAGTYLLRFISLQGSTAEKIVLVR